MPLDGPAEPWLSFLTELDAQLDAPVDFHCIGGFVVSQHYGLGRETADLDVLAVIPREVTEQVIQLPARDSLCRRNIGSTSNTSELRTTRQTTKVAWSGRSRYGQKFACGLWNRFTLRNAPSTVGHL